MLLGLSLSFVCILTAYMTLYGPQTGNARLAGGTFLGVFWLVLVAKGFVPSLVGGSLLIFYLVGFIDDRWAIPAKYKLLMTCFAALPLAWLSPWLYMLALTASHTSNLLDGKNGLAAGYSIICLICLSLLNIWHGDLTGGVGIAFFCMGLAVYLAINISGKWYLGDSGSLPLGAYLAFEIWEYGAQTPYLLAYLACLNVCYAIYQRRKIGRKPWDRTLSGLHERGREVAPLLVGQTMIAVAVAGAIMLAPKSLVYFVLGLVVIACSYWILEDRYWLDQKHADGIDADHDG